MVVFLVYCFLNILEADVFLLFLAVDLQEGVDRVNFKSCFSEPL